MFWNKEYKHAYACFDSFIAAQIVEKMTPMLVVVEKQILAEDMMLFIIDENRQHNIDGEHCIQTIGEAKGFLDYCLEKENNNEGMISDYNNYLSLLSSFDDSSEIRAIYEWSFGLSLPSDVININDARQEVIEAIARDEKEASSRVRAELK